MKMVFPLLSRLTGKKILFPRVHIRNISPPGRDLFWRAAKWEKFWEKQIFKMGDINLKKNDSVSLYSKISGLDSHFIFGGSSMSIRYSKTTNLSCLLKFWVNRIIIELLLQCIEWLRNAFSRLLHRKKLSHSWENAFTGENISTPDQDLG